MINAMGVINAAQIQSMQQMAAMQAMGMMPTMGGGMMGGQGGMMGGNGYGFAQTEAVSVDERTQMFAQVASTLVSMPPNELEKIKTHLAQVGLSDNDEDSSQVLAQTATSEDIFGDLADMMMDLDDQDLAQISSFIDDMAVANE